MDNYKTTSQLLFTDDSDSSYELEEKIIEQAITTPFEKVLKILSNVKVFVNDMSKETNKNNYDLNKIIKDLEWVITRIQSHTLYTYEIEEDNQDKIANENPEMKSLFEFLSDYSEQATVARTRNNKTSNSTKLLYNPLNNNIDIKNNYATISDGNFYNWKSPGLKKRGNNFIERYSNKNLHQIKTNEPFFKIKENSQAINETERSFMNKSKSAESPTKPQENKNNDVRQSTQSLSKSNLIYCEKKSENNSQKLLLDLSVNQSENKYIIQILNPNFNIHEFDEKVGRKNLLPIIGHSLLEVLELKDLINKNKLNLFLEKLNEGYLETVTYHNSVHASDVALSVTNFLLNSNLENLIKISSNDILILIIASLAHDIGHPGTNNTFQINTYSEQALVYNDQSVLENYHSSLFFKICLKKDCNIFDKLSDSQFKYIRKRGIKMILATDMMCHAKIVSMTKSKILTWKENFIDLEMTPLVKEDSNSFFDDQQMILDFVVHTADLSHNSKSFAISAKWLDLLMEELWSQGDIERNMGIPISFLCDRYTADNAKNQIGFIKGIILPTFDVLIDLLPDLDYLKKVIENNLDEWIRISEEKKGNGLDEYKSPRSKRSERKAIK